MKINWDLEKIINNQKFENYFEEVKKEILLIDEKLKVIEKEIGKSEFKDLIEWEENLAKKINRLAYYPGLQQEENQKNQEVLKRKSMVDNLLLEYSNKMRKFWFWLKGLDNGEIKGLSEEKARILFEEVADLKNVWWYLREQAKHSLKANEEKIIDFKDMCGIGPLNDLRGMIEAEMEYKVGKKIIKSQAEVIKLIHSKKARTRKEAYLGLFKAHQKEIDKLFLIYQAIVKNWKYEARERKYKNEIEMRNKGNWIENKTVDQLLDVCDKNREVFQKFFKLKAKLLKTKKLNRFDLYAPTYQENKKYTLEEGIEIILTAFGKFDSRFEKVAREIIEDNQIDYYPKKNKRNGAFCATVVPELKPFILMNWTGSLRDILTLAHELGHGIHSVLANKHYPMVQEAGLPLAETASTLTELIVFNEVIEKSENKKGLWVEKIGDIYATVGRQAFFVMFEKQAFELIDQGGGEKEISNLYLKELKKQFGKEVMIDSNFKYEWSYVSHFFNSPFYCYAYSFGELLALSLWNRQDKKMIFEILEAGGSDSIEKILKRAGITTDLDFFKNGFKEIEKMIEKASRL